MNEEEIKKNEEKNESNEEENTLEECGLCGVKLPLSEMVDNGGGDLVCEDCV